MTENTPNFKNSLFAWAQLVRLPNIFTVWADVTMAFCFTLGAGIFTLRSAWLAAYCLLLAAASLMYAAGMILNDLHDLPEDTRLRPERPLVRGAITPKAAKRAAYGAMLGGFFLFLVAAAMTAANGGLFFAAVPAALLAGCILLYNTRLKETLTGPFLMGACRALNLLAVMGVAAGPNFLQYHLLIPAAMFLYITSLTFYARNETEEGMRKSGVPLGVLSVLGMMGGILMLYPVVGAIQETFPSLLNPVLAEEPWRWMILIIFLALFVGGRTFSPLLGGNPKNVRRGVKQAIFTLFILDAALVFAVTDIFTAVVILAMMIPAVILGNYLYST